MLTIGAGVLLVVLEPWHGPILISLSATHGVDTGDLIVLPLAALAIFLGRCGLEPSDRRRDADVDITSTRRALGGPVSAMAVGGLLLVVGIGLLVSSSALTPSGGGTFDGTIRHVGGHSSIPVAAWTHVAVTYDGEVLRLYVNGAEVSQENVSGRIQPSTNPLWIGGNQPYGEYFIGVIDEIRVYNRALDRAEIVRDLDRPIEVAGLAADSTLVAAYAFEAGSGTKTRDSSGHGHLGTLRGPEWTTTGKFGGALRFGGNDTVRIEASPSLDLGAAMTVSAWIMPAASQGGWRTIVQREADAYLLDASNDLPEYDALLDHGIATAVTATAVWFAVGLVASGGRWMGWHRRSWPLGVTLLLSGCLLDAALTPTATAFGPLLVATWLAATATRRVDAMIGWAVVAVLTAINVVSLAGVGT